MQLLSCSCSMLAHGYVAEATMRTIISGGTKDNSSSCCNLFRTSIGDILSFDPCCFVTVVLWFLLVPSFVDGWCSRQLTARTHCWLFCFIATTDWHVCPLAGYQPRCLSPKERRPKTILLAFVRSVRLRSTMSLTLVAVALSTSIVEDQLDHVVYQTAVEGSPAGVEG